MKAGISLGLPLIVVCAAVVVGQNNATVEMRSTLAPSGTLRAVFLGSNPVQGRIDSLTGEVTGPAADLIRMLARRMNVPFSIRGLDGVAAVMEAVSAGSADIGFLAFDPTRAVQVNFTHPYSIGHNAYLVRQDSRIQKVEDADRAGILIGVGSGDAVDLHLTRTLKQAQLVRPANRTMEEAARMLTAGEIDAFAANQQRLTEIAARTPNLRIVPGSVLPVQQSMVVKKENTAGVTLLNRFIDEARDSGFLRDAIARAQLAGVEVAPRSAQ
jgi:polar amino acid transport system substrate-binding protein